MRRCTFLKGRPRVRSLLLPTTSRAYNLLKGTGVHPMGPPEGITWTAAWVSFTISSTFGSSSRVSICVVTPRTGSASRSLRIVPTIRLTFHRTSHVFCCYDLKGVGSSSPRCLTDHAGNNTVSLIASGTCTLRRRSCASGQMRAWPNRRSFPL